MRTLRLLLAALLVSASAFAQQNDTAATGIVSVSSVYVDEATGQPTRFTGTGFIAEGGTMDSLKKVYLVTSAHLSQGTDLEINGVPIGKLAHGARCADSFHDAEVIELENSDGHWQPLASYSRGDGSFLLNEKAIGLWKSLGNRTLTVGGGLDETEVPMPAWSAQSQARPYSKSAMKGWDAVRGDADEFYRSDSLNYTALGGLLWAPASLAPGMSGSPVIEWSVVPLVRGIGAEFVRGVRGSYFTSDIVLGKLLETQTRGKCESGAVDSTKWKNRKGLLYREFSPGRQEIAPTTEPSGNGVYTPPGNGVYTPPGNGVYTPPGKKGPALDDGDSPSAMLWDGKPVIAFKVQPSSGDRELFLYPNQATMELLKNAEKAMKRVEPVSAGTSLQPALASKVGAATQAFTASSNVGATSMLSGKTAKIESDSSGIRITLYGPAPAAEEIPIRLDASGALQGTSSTFTPIVHVKSVSGKAYTVDLRDLFFTDLESAVSPTAGEGSIRIIHQVMTSGSKSEKRELVSRLFGEMAKKHAYITYKDETTGVEYRLAFGGAVPLGSGSISSDCVRGADTPAVPQIPGLGEVLDHTQENKKPSRRSSH